LKFTLHKKDKGIRHNCCIRFRYLGTKKVTSIIFGKEIKNLAMEQGLFIRPLGNVIYLLPPLCITDDQLEKSYWVIRQILDNL